MGYRGNCSNESVVYYACNQLFIAFTVIQGSKFIDIFKMHGNYYWLVENNNDKQLLLKLKIVFIYRSSLVK